FKEAAQEIDAIDYPRSCRNHGGCHCRVIYFAQILSGIGVGGDRKEPLVVWRTHFAAHTNSCQYHVVLFRSWNARSITAKHCPQPVDGLDLWDSVSRGVWRSRNVARKVNQRRGFAWVSN